jgi:hypothetical protein
VLGNILLRSVLFVILLQSCSSLNDSEIQNLTTCKASIKEIRRRLLKVGASLTADEKDFLRTDYSYFNFGFKYKTAFFIDNANGKNGGTWSRLSYKVSRIYKKTAWAD